MRCALKGSCSAPPPVQFEFRNLHLRKDMFFSSLTAAECFNQFSDRFAPVIHLRAHLGNIERIHEVCFFLRRQLHKLRHLPHNILPGRSPLSVDNFIHGRTVESAELRKRVNPDILHGNIFG